MSGEEREKHTMWGARLQNLPKLPILPIRCAVAGSGLLTNYLPVWADDSRTGRHVIAGFVGIVGLVGPCGFIPLLQLCAMRRDEAQHGAWIQTGDEDELEPSAGRLDSDRVSIVVVLDMRDAVK